MNLKLFFFAVFLTVVLLPTHSFACACCAERGHYSINVSKPDKFVLGELQNIDFSTANLYTDAGYPDTIKGISPLNDKFSVDAMLSGANWKFEFKDNQAKSGVLNLTTPISMVSYMVDLEPSDVETPSMVTLYKEWRFKYNIKSAAGIFKNGYAPKTEYFLVLQGRGNACTSAADFTHWRLEVTGRNAAYAFFGKLKTENSNTANTK